MQVLNGSLVTTDATDQEIIPMEPDGEAVLKPAGRNVFCFDLVSGSVKMGVGSEIDLGDFTHASHATAGEKWVHTASPSLAANANGNLHGKGVATFKIYW